MIRLWALLLAGAAAGLAQPAPPSEVRIAYFGPSDPAHPEGGGIWQAASLAIEEANHEGGYKGMPFRLLPAWSENPWAGGISSLVKLVYNQNVWAVVGGIDGASTHLVEQIAPKAFITIFNPASSDRTIHNANVPWMFSAVPSDVLHIRLLARVVEPPFVMVSAMDHDSRAFASRMKGSLPPPLAQIEFEGGAENLSGMGRRVADSKARTALVVAGPRDAARAIKAIRKAGFAGQIVGNDSLGREVCIREAGAAAEGALFPLLENPSPALDEFRRKFQARFGRPADFAASHSYDTVRMLVAAIRKAGLNREAIRDALRDLSGYQGVTGEIRFDKLGQNERPVRLGIIRGGRPVEIR